MHTEKELGILQDRYLMSVLNALDDSEKSPAVEVPQNVLDSDDDFIAWAKSFVASNC